MADCQAFWAFFLSSNCTKNCAKIPAGLVIMPQRSQAQVKATRKKLPTFFRWGARKVNR